jgi:hypothetical protein
MEVDKRLMVKYPQHIPTTEKNYAKVWQIEELLQELLLSLETLSGEKGQLG